MPNTDDAGPGSLRQALLEANASPGSDAVVFVIPGAGPHSIVPGTPLPALTDTILIDGYSQPGAAPNTLAAGWNAQVRIEIDGSLLNSQGNVSPGLDLTTGAGSVVRGLAFIHWRGVALRVRANDSVVTGNLFGLRADARTRAGNGSADTAANGTVRVERTVAGNGLNIRIGGPLPADRNIVSGNNYGITLRGAGMNRLFAAVVEGNWLGLDGSGAAAVSNQLGRSIDLFSTEGAVLRGNVIVGPNDLGPVSGTGAGISLTGDGGANIGTSLFSNRIGVDPVGDGLTVGLIPFGVDIGVDVRAAGTSGTDLGEVGNPAAGNLIAYARNVELRLTSGSQRTRLSGNRIFGGALGIDIQPTAGQPNPNDPLDADSGTNGLQNAPELASAAMETVPTPGTQLLAQLPSAPNSVYRVEFFGASECAGSGFGPAQALVAAIDVTTDAVGIALIDARLPPIVPGRWLSAIATDASGNSSEFSNCVQVSRSGARGAVALASTRYLVSEYGTGVFAVVRRLPPFNGAVSVRLVSEDASAVAGLDYAPIDTVLSWNDGESSLRPVSIVILDDLEIEPEESFNLRLRDPTGGVAPGVISGSVVKVKHVFPEQVFADGFEE